MHLRRVVRIIYRRFAFACASSSSSTCYVIHTNIFASHIIINSVVIEYRQIRWGCHRRLSLSLLYSIRIIPINKIGIFHSTNTFIVKYELWRIWEVGVLVQWRGILRYLHAHFGCCVCNSITVQHQSNTIQSAPSLQYRTIIIDRYKKNTFRPNARAKVEDWICNRPGRKSLILLILHAKQLGINRVV